MADSPQHRGDEELGEPSHTVLYQGRLVAYAWPSEGGGTLRRAGANAEARLEVPFAEVRVFTREVENLVVDLLPRCSGLSSLLFKLGMEGYDVQPGRVSPSSSLRRF